MSIRRQLNNFVVFSVACCLFAGSMSTAQDMKPKAHTGTIIEQPYQNQPVQQYPIQGQPIQQIPMQQQPVQPQAHTGTIIQNPNQQVLLQLKGILNQQAQLGKFPSNNALLKAIQDTVTLHGNPHSMPPVNTTLPSQNSSVMITNAGPGNLQITSPNQVTMVLPAGSSHQMVVNQTINFKAIQGNTNIAIKHLHGPLAKFWDADDNRFTRLRPNQTQNYELGINKQGYQLMKYN